MSTTRGPRPAAMVRAVSGVLTGGLVALAVLVVVAGVLASWRSVAGPTTGMVVIHVAAAVVAVIVQVLGDRRGRSGASAVAVVVLAITAALLWTQWWA